MALEDLTPTSELEAVNALLRSIGESPIAALSSGHPDETAALEMIKEVSREVQTQRWRFNTEFNYSIATTGNDSNGWPVYEVPTNISSWTLARTEAQRGLDLVEREERDAQPSDGARLFADRLNGTDGIEALDSGSSGDPLLINPVWIVDYTVLPQAARTYITVMAARRFASQMVGANSDSSFGFTAEDEQRAFAELVNTQKEQIPVVPLRVTAGTELDAVNQILMAAGQDPVVNLSAIDTMEEFRALQTFRDAEREVQAEGWRFNSDLSFELESNDTYDWVDSDSTTTTLSVFTLSDLPAALTLLSWRLAPTSGLVGLDLVERPSLRYNSGGTDILFDRLLNRDGLENSAFPRIYLDVIWLIEYGDAPEEYRRYVTRLATRRFLQGLPQPPQTLPWTEEDLRLAKRQLERTHGDNKPRNIFDNASAYEALGRRRGRGGRHTRQSNRR